MRTRLLLAAVLAVAPMPALAGLYDPEMPALSLGGDSGFEPLPFSMFRDRLLDLLQMAVPVPSKYRDMAVKHRDELAKIHDPSPVQRIRLAIIRIRLRETDAAIADLRQDPRFRGDFFANAVLGTAYQQIGQYDEAAQCLDVAHALLSEMKPTDWPGTLEVLKAVRTIEAAQRKLVRLRLAERKNAPRGRPGPPADVDDLFGVKFVGESGAYEPGKLAAAELAKLPADAEATVQQLLLFLPDDTRLYWLLGEIYAARGDLNAARQILDECVNARRLDSPLLRQHRQAVMDALAAQAANAGALPTHVVWILSALAALAGCLVLLQLFVLARRWSRARA